jgi:hypothetical protein
VYRRPEDGAVLLDRAGGKRELTPFVTVQVLWESDAKAAGRSELDKSMLQELAEGNF